MKSVTGVKSIFMRVKTKKTNIIQSVAFHSMETYRLGPLLTILEYINRAMRYRILWAIFQTYKFILLLSYLHENVLRVAIKQKLPRKWQYSRQNNWQRSLLVIFI